MKLSVTDVSPVEKQIEVVVSPDEVEEEFDAAYQKIGQKARLKGFRPGKVPRGVLDQYYRGEIETEAVNGIVAKTFRAALEEAGLNPVAPPEVTVNGFGPSREFSYRISVEIRPVVEVKGYSGMKLSKEKIDVAAGEIEDNLKGLQERMTRLIPVTEARKPRARDVVGIDFQGFLGERPVPKFGAKDYRVELGVSALFPELEAGIMEMSAGEKKRIDVTYPPDWADKNIAGKTVALEVYLKEIKEKLVPELNDDLAKDLGSFGTLEEVRTKVREDILRGKEQAAKDRLRRQVIENLIRENEFPVPEGMIRREQEEMFGRLEGTLKSQGISLEQAGVTREDFFQKNRDEALFRVKGGLLFDAVAQKENIAVTAEEVDRRIEDMSRLAGQSAEVWKKYYREKKLLFQVEGALREEKTLDFVLSQSKIEVCE